MIRNTLRVNISSRNFSSSVFKQYATTSEEKIVPIDTISSSLFISRIPIVTPELSEFETKYYNYQDELQRRLMWTFPYYYYFKKSSLGEAAFFKNQKWPVSRQPNVFYPKGTPDIKHLRERRSKQVINLEEKVDEKDLIQKEKVSSQTVVPNSRITEADEKKNLKSLERCLDKTLYLIVKDNVGDWKFPTFKYNTGEKIVPLDIYAKDNFEKISSKDLNIFTVTNKPIHVLKYDSKKSINNESPEIVSREYIIKSHIVAGDFELNDNSVFKDYLWVNNQELPEYLNENYYQNIEFLLSGI